MKVNRFLALAVIAIMAVGVMGFITTKTHAQSGTSPSQQAQVTESADNEAAVGTDADNVDEQVGDQNGQNDASGSTNEAVETKDAEGQDAVPTGTPSISSDAALQAAQSYLNTTAAGTATLDEENGKLVYSVELNGSDVKVDAMTGAILGANQVGDGQSEGVN